MIQFLDIGSLLYTDKPDKLLEEANNYTASLSDNSAKLLDAPTQWLVELPIAMLLSEEPLETVAKKVEELQKAWKKLGCAIESPFMALSLLALPVLHEPRITDKGLVDTKNFHFEKLLID